MKYYGLTDRGLVRPDNQDTFAILPVPARDCVIIAVCDGMGGQNSGSYAGELAKRAFTEHTLAKLTSRVNKNPDIHQVLESACGEANHVVLQYSLFTEEYKGMGSTLVGGVLYGSGRVCLANVGDSRAYRISPRENVVRQITTDHSLVELYVGAGILTREQAKNHRQKNVITRAIGMEQAVQSDFFELTLKKGESVVLCSDGVSNPVSDAELLRLAKETVTPEPFCRAVRELVLQRGAPDNFTVLMASR